MPGDSLINIGELSKPATVLIKRVSDAIGGIAKPWQIKRVAKAEAAAVILKAEGDIRVSELQQRALIRLAREEAQKQENIENITRKATQYLHDDSKPENIGEDWITHFFDKSRLTTDEQMQELWARILAGEANMPGTVSRRTVALVETLDKNDAEQFTKLCELSWMIHRPYPMIYDLDQRWYTDRNITFETLSHLDSVGLIQFNPVSEFLVRSSGNKIVVQYYGEPFLLELPENRKEGGAYVWHTGKIMFTRSGEDLAKVCGAKPLPGFVDYILDVWRAHGAHLACPYPNATSRAGRS